MKTKKGKTSFQFKHKLMIISLIVMIGIGATFFLVDGRVEILEAFLGIIFGIRLIGLIGNLCLIFSRRKIGYLLGGILAWCTVGFLLLDNFHMVFDISVIASRPSFNNL